MTVATAATAMVEDLLRLAWLAGTEGKPGLRDALLTLAVAESGPAEAVLAERCRRLLVARQPDHWFGTSPTLGQALSHPRVVTALTKLRAMFPPVRIHRILMRAEVQRGPYTGEPLPLTQILEELGLMPDRRSAVSSSTRRRDQPPADAPARPRVAFTAPDDTSSTPTEPPPLDAPADESEALAPLYLALLFTMAVLLQTVREQRLASRDEQERDRDDAGTRAA